MICSHTIASVSRTARAAVHDSLGWRLLVHYRFVLTRSAPLRESLRSGNIGICYKMYCPSQANERHYMLRIILTGVLVDDQQKALEFYTDVLGFQVKHDVPVGVNRWLTVVSPDDPDGVEFLLEPNDNPASSTFQQAIFEQGIPAHMFGVDDIESEVERLKELGVEFFMEPTDAGQVTIAIFNDTCGNLIQIMQTNET